MNKKMTAIVFATVLASPLAIAKISMADGGRGKTRTALATSGTSTSFESEYERRFVVPAVQVGGATGRGEVEVEFVKRTRTDTTGVTTTTTKLEAEIEALIPGSAPIDPLLIDADITVGGVMCTFSALAKTAVVPVLINNVAFQKVAIEGSAVVVSPATTATDKGLTCTGDITIRLGTELVTVKNITGLGATIADPTPGNLVLDN